MNQQPVSFPNWKEAIAREPLSPAIRADYIREIIRFLTHCKACRAPATVELVRHYLSIREKTATGPAREALRWFFRNGSRRPSAAGTATTSAEATGSMPGDRSTARAPERRAGPGLAAQDLGGPDWERDLIKASRERGFLWRTEETYRSWAARFARFLSPKSPYAATGQEVAAFLSSLAVELRASPSTQKQALNALVFFMQEALHRSLGPMNFKRAYPRRRVPTVLSRDECARLFAAMQGTHRLMAELAYGAGLRLMELLRLRVHHVDLERQRLLVFAGKGDQDRITVLPEKLLPQLQEQLAGLRRLWTADRSAGLPGVWMPEGLARKYPGAAGSLEWQWLFPRERPASTQRAAFAEDIT